MMKKLLLGFYFFKLQFSFLKWKENNKNRQNEFYGQYGNDRLNKTLKKLLCACL